MFGLSISHTKSRLPVFTARAKFAILLLSNINTFFKRHHKLAVFMLISKYSQSTTSCHRIEGNFYLKVDKIHFHRKCEAAVDLDEEVLFMSDVESCDILIWMRTLKIGELPSRCLFSIRKMTAQHRTHYTVLFVLICVGTVALYSLGALAEGISEVHVYMQKNVQCASDGLLQFKLLKHVGFNTHLSDDPEVCMNVVCF